MRERRRRASRRQVVQGYRRGGQGRAFLYVLAAAFVLGGIGGLFLTGGGRVLVRQLDAEQRSLYLERQTAVQPFKIASEIAGYVVWIGVRAGAVSVVGYVLYRGVSSGLNWLDLKSRQIHARDGVFPVIELEKGALYDPNRDNAGAHPLITIAALGVQKAAALKAENITLKASEKALPEVAGALAVDEAGALPDMVLLSEIARNPSLDALTLGVSEAGPVRASLYELMHVLAVGASGFGKSGFLRSVIWQLAQVKEPVDVVAIDVNGSEFNQIRNWSRLLYPVARDTKTAVATLGAVRWEIERRKSLYDAIPQAYDLPSYNRRAGDPLAPVVILADEATNLLNQAGLGDPLREVVQTARQYGVFLLLAGQSAKASVIDTQVRDNFSTRLCFHTSPSSRRVVLGESVDDVTEKGRAWSQLTGAELRKIQVPYVSREEVARVLETGPAKGQLIDVEVSPVEIAVDDDARRVVQLKSQGFSDTAIARDVFKHGTSHYIDKVRKILQQQQQNAFV